VTFDESSFPSTEAITREADEFVEMPIVDSNEALPVPAEAGHIENQVVQQAQGGPPAGAVLDEGAGQAPAVRVPLLPRNARLMDGAAVLTIATEPAAGFVDLSAGMMAFPAGMISDDPRSFKEAMRSAQAKDWLEAMKREYNSLLANKTWKLVGRPKDANIIGSRWVFTMKRNDAGIPVRPKARFVAKGYSQQFGFDVFETWAPVTRLTSIRSVLSLAANERLGV
jgi:hypothetical protein